MDAQSSSAEHFRSTATHNDSEQLASTKSPVKDVVVAASEAPSASEHGDQRRSSNIPLKMKLFAILLVTATGFGSHWSSGVTGAMKSTLKKVEAANDAQDKTMLIIIEITYQQRSIRSTGG